MKKEILQAIAAAARIEEEKKSLLVGTGISRIPKDSEGNLFGSPIMIHFDGGRGSVFFRASDEEGDPFGFEFPLPVAEALLLALNDLLGTFDGAEAEKVAEMEAEIKSQKAAAKYWADEFEAKGEKLARSIAFKKELLAEIEMKNKRLADLEHFAASVSGLYATDRPDIVDQSLLNDVVLFKIEPPEAEK